MHVESAGAEPVDAGETHLGQKGDPRLGRSHRAGPGGLHQRDKAELAKDRERLVIPPDSSAVGALAPRYRSADLGELAVLKRNDQTIFDFGEWRTAVGSRKNDDGTLSFIGIEAAFLGIEFVIGERDGKRVLITRDGQHEYAFSEAGS